MKTSNEFLDYFNEKLKENLTTIQAQRELTHQIITIYSVVFLFFSAIIFYLTFFKEYVITSFIWFFIFIFFLITVNNKIAKFKAPQKQLITDIVKFIDKEFIYESKGTIPQSVYIESKLFPKQFSSYRGDDLIKGCVDGINFEFCEIKTEKIEKRINRDGESEAIKKVVLFHGIFFVADFNKTVDGYVKILPKPPFSLKKIVPEWLLPTDSTRVKVGYPEFEEIFEVYGSSQIDTRYILNYAMMERLLGLYDFFKRSIYISVVKDKLYISVKYNKDMFELTKEKRLDDESVAKEYFNTINSFVKIVEVLKLEK